MITPETSRKRRGKAGGSHTCGSGEDGRQREDRDRQEKRGKMEMKSKRKKKKEEGTEQQER